MANSSSLNSDQKERFELRPNFSGEPKTCTERIVPFLIFTTTEEFEQVFGEV
jgi:hypothetical protein